MIPRRFILLFALSGFLFLQQSLAAQARPMTYAQVLEQLPELWKKRYPVEVARFLPDPAHAGILAGLHENRPVYYYQFSVVVILPGRDQEGARTQTGEKNIEIWVRYRPGIPDPLDLTFVRRDRLPGTNFRWIR